MNASKTGVGKHPFGGPPLADLQAVVGSEWLLTGESAEVEKYGRDATFITSLPEAVVFPASTAEVAAVVRVCSSAGIAMTARGAGTGLSGGAVPIAGGIVVSLERLKLCEIDRPSLCAKAGAGVITADLQAAADQVGLMYPPDPGSVTMSTIGGNIACNAGGMRCLKYGVTADYVLGLTVVLHDGSVVELGGPLRKRASGYRLSQLFVGSEGTLGIVTEAVLKLVAAPRVRSTALVTFASLDDAAQAVSRTIGAGLMPAALELLDSRLLRLMKDFLPSGLPEDAGAALIVEHDGADRDAVDAELYRSIEKLGGTDERIAQSSHERERLWDVRRRLDVVLERDGRNYFGEDVAVPVSRIPEMVACLVELADSAGVDVATVAHAGDGNLHPLILYRDDQRDVVGPLADAILRAAASLGGTVSAEHGLGVLKRDFATLEHNPAALALMAKVKGLLDPSGLLNPQKLIPLAEPSPSFLEQQPGWSP